MTALPPCKDRTTTGYCRLAKPHACRFLLSVRRCPKRCRAHRRRLRALILAALGETMHDDPKTRLVRTVYLDRLDEILKEDDLP